LDNGNYKYKIYTVTIQSGDTLKLVEEVGLTGDFKIENVKIPFSKFISLDKYSKGAIFNIELHANKLKNIKELRYTIEYDPQHLSILEVNLGDFIIRNDNNAKIETKIDNKNGIIDVKISITLTDGISGEGTILKLKFNSIKDGGVKLTQTYAYGFDINKIKIEFIKIDKIIIITPLQGDINGDGKVDSEDLIIFAKAFGTKLGDPDYNEKCDLNGDGKVDAEDLLLLAQNFGTQAP
jgi:hypothetical protein